MKKIIEMDWNFYKIKEQINKLNQAKNPLNYLLYEMEITIKIVIALNNFILYILTIKEQFKSFIIIFSQNHIITKI